MYLGDYRRGQQVTFYFNTRNLDNTFATLSGGVLNAADGSSVTAIGLTLTADAHGIQGLNRVVVALEDGFYAVGLDFMVWLQQGTVNGVDCSGTVLANFSIRNRDPSAVVVPAGYMGDLPEDGLFHFRFRTYSGGAPISLGGTPSLKFTKAAGGFNGVDGGTLNVDAGETGFHRVDMDLSAASFFEPGKDYAIFLSGCTVGGVSVESVQIGSFSIENRAAQLAGSDRRYFAQIELTVDDENSVDEWQIQLLNDGVPSAQESGTVTLAVYPRNSATPLYSNSACTDAEAGVAGAFRAEASGEARVTPGDAVLAVVTWTKGGASRSFSRWVSRDDVS